LLQVGGGEPNKLLCVTTRAMEKQNECRSGIDREKYYTVKDNYK
jgi:hypothetical protein